jgi:putative restriction endonuclease
MNTATKFLYSLDANEGERARFPMAHGVFMQRSDSIYEDSPAVQYQFPKQYLLRAEGSVGDWILYLEPTKVKGSRGYFAVARLQQIIKDPKAANMYLALIEPGTFLEFANIVPFNDDNGPMERGLLNERGKLSGRAQAAIRPITNEDFNRIVEQGLEDREQILPREGSFDTEQGFAETQVAFDLEQQRDRVFRLTSRTIRDRIFRRTVLRAYGERCAVTGLKLINGLGRAEVNAAHILPVEMNGPDTVQNGLALSGTAHWMFDRGIITLENDLKIIISRHANDQDGIRAFINRSGFATPPVYPRDRPHSKFLEWHRLHRFKT